MLKDVKAIVVYAPRGGNVLFEGPQRKQAVEMLKSGVGLVAIHSGMGADQGETILVVEDDDDVRAYIVEILNDLGYRVLQAPDADSARSIIDRKKEKVDLLLTDVVLPGMNGRELADEVTKRRAGIKVLFMTGYSRNAIVHQGRLDPGVEMIQKPFTQGALAARIRTLLDVYGG